MPFQLNGQPVTTKSSRLLHVAGCDRAFVVAAGGAFVAMMSSAADASDAYGAPASTSINPAETPNFFMLPPIARGRTKRATRARNHFCAVQDSRTTPPKVLYLCARDIQH